MQYADAKREANQTARDNRVKIAVVLDRYAEDPNFPYGYVPVAAMKVLYRGGKVVGVANPSGEYVEAGA